MLYQLLHEGMLLLSSICVASIIAFKIYRRIFSKVLYVDVERGMDYVDTASVTCTFFGGVFLVISVFSNLLSFTAKTSTESVLFSNQIMLMISAMVLWVVFLVMRAKYGRELWNNSLHATGYSLVGFVGFYILVLAGSIRGHLHGQGSILDPLYNVFNVNPVQFWAVETMGVYTLIIVSVLAGITFTGIYGKSKAH